MSGQVARRCMFAAIAMLLLSACRLDVTVDIDVEPDGTGSIVVTTVADAALVERVPDLAEQLVLDDVVAAGWVVDGPTPTEDGGLRIVLSHTFSSDDEATNLIRSLGPPFRSTPNAKEVGRGVVGDVTNNSLSFGLTLPEGFAEFADADLVSTVGAVPFADEFAAAGATPETSMSVTVTADLPGAIDDSRTTSETVDGRLRWEADLSPGGFVLVEAFSEQSPDEDRPWARPLSIVALIALIAWVAFMSLFIGYVAFARWRRARRYRNRKPPPIPTG
ncbi:MAG: hypothetical protein AAGD33_05505 [Actinomycetota bacterium]